MSLTGLAFLIVFVAVMGLALFRHPLFGLYGYVALFYLHPPSRWWGEMLPDIRWSLLAAGITLIASLRLPSDRTRRSWISTTPAKILIAYTIWMAIQSAWALDREQHVEAIVLFGKYVVLYYLVYRLIDTEDKVRDFLMVHVVGTFYFGYLAYSMEVSGRLEGVGGPGVDESNALAMQMATAVAVAAMLLLAEKGWRRWMCVAAMPFLLNAIVLAGSRGAFLALIFCGIVLWRLKPDAYRRWFYWYAGLGLILLVILAHEPFWERVQTIRTAVDAREELDTSALSRLELFDAQWRMFRAHPLGTGHRGTEVLSVYYLEEKYLSVNPDGTRATRSSHNTFMTALVEQGVPGVVLFVALWLWVYRTLVQVKRDTVDGLSRMAGYSAALGGALTVVFVAGWFVDYLKAEVQVWLFALVASLAAIARLRPAPGARAVDQSSGYPAAASRSRSAGNGKPSSYARRA
jgi:O-antigen ligase